MHTVVRETNDIARDYSECLTEMGFKLRHLGCHFRLSVTTFLLLFPASLSLSFHSDLGTSNSGTSTTVQSEVALETKRENHYHPLVLHSTHSGTHACWQTRSNLNRWQHKDKFSRIYAMPSFTDSTAQPLASQSFTLL